MKTHSEAEQIYSDIRRAITLCESCDSQNIDLVCIISPKTEEILLTLPRYTENLTDMQARLLKKAGIGFIGGAFVLVHENMPSDTKFIVTRSNEAKVWCKYWGAGESTL